MRSSFDNSSLIFLSSFLLLFYLHWKTMLIMSLPRFTKIMRPVVTMNEYPMPKMVSSSCTKFVSTIIW